MELNQAEVIRLLRIDEMTGLYNRVYFLERVREDMMRSERYGWPLCILVVSLDDFARIHSRHGTIISDNVLVTMATMVRKFARNTDIVCRHDPTRFALLLPGTSEDGGLIIAERLHNRITAHLFSTPDGRPIQVTCSLGLAGYRESLTSAEDFLAAAEAALTEAQAAGGGRWAAAKG